VAVAALALTLPQLLLHVALVGLAAALFYVAVGDILRLAAPPHAAARGLRAASAAAAIVAVIAVAALPAAATEGAGEGLAAATTQPAATTHARAAKGRRQPRSREVCLSAREVKRLAAAGVQPPAGTHLRADGRLCGRR
jgi:hypothetical protein